MNERKVEVMELVDELYTMVSEAWGVPLGNDKCIIERETVLEMLNEIRTRLPAELSEAKQVLSAKEEFISNAKREAESVRKTAEDKAHEMLEEQEVIKRAKAYSAQIVSEAEQKSSELRKVASDYVDDILRRTEESVAGALKSVNQVRAGFRNVTGSTESEEKAD